jgi:hypothetical protein
LLVYGIAGLVFGLAAKGLTSSERQPLVWFLVVFPALVLLLFAWLVARHHTKLYAPTDYRDAEGFFRALSPTEQRTRIAAEVEVIEAEVANEPASTDVAHSVAPSDVADRDALARKSDRPASSSKDRRAETVSFVAQRRRELHAAVLLAEDLALRELSAEFGEPMIRQVSLGDAGADAIIATPTTRIAIEIKYVRPTTAPEQLADATLAHSALLLRRTLEYRMRLLLAVVADGFSPAEINELRKHLEQQISATSSRIELRLLNFADLKRKFGIPPA